MSICEHELLSNEFTKPSVKSRGNHRFMVDYGNIKNKRGDYCVYVWVTERCEIFYIGMGDEYRACRPYGRNDGFKQRYNTERIQSFILCRRASKRVADEIETMLIWKAQKMGWKLENKAKRFSDSISEASYYNFEKQQMVCGQEIFEKWMSEYHSVLKMFEQLNEYCLDCVLSDDGVIKEGYWQTNTSTTEQMISLDMTNEEWDEFLEKAHHLNMNPKELFLKAIRAYSVT